MSTTKTAPLADPALLCTLQQFYYREARLLDERRYMEWHGLLEQSVRYVVLSRFVPAAERQTGSEGDDEAHNIARETSGVGAHDNPMRDENNFQLLMRADRAKKSISWSDNPPPFTRRFVSNVELVAIDGDQLTVRNNLLLYYSRHGRRDVYTGRREDQLLATDDSYRMLRREVLLDWNVVTGPTVGLFF